MIIDNKTKLKDITGLEKLTIDKFNQVVYLIERCKITGLVVDLDLENMLITVIKEETNDTQK